MCLFPVVVEANMLFCAYFYFSFKNLISNFTLKSIGANLVPDYHYNLAFCIIYNSMIANIA